MEEIGKMPTFKVWLLVSVWIVLGILTSEWRTNAQNHKRANRKSLNNAPNNFGLQNDHSGLHDEGDIQQQQGRLGQRRQRQRKGQRQSKFFINETSKVMLYLCTNRRCLHILIQFQYFIQSYPEPSGNYILFLVSGQALELFASTAQHVSQCTQKCK